MTLGVLMRVAPAFAAVLLMISACGTDQVTGEADELTETSSTLKYTGNQSQYAGGFKPSNAPFGGFGGSRCKATKTPVVFVPGNGDDARNFDFPPNVGGKSVYATLKAAGYRDCELFGVNWLSPEARLKPLENYHDAVKAKIVADFVGDVLAFTGAAQVDIIGHSMGATVALQGAELTALKSKIRRFIAISGALRGLAVCPLVGYANPTFPVCGSQNLVDSNTYGLYPDSFWVRNPRMGAAGYRTAPNALRNTKFYTIGAGIHDGFLCESTAFTADCAETALFSSRSNVLAQLDVGHGSTSIELDYDLTDYSIFKAGGGDIDGVGHFRAKNNTGAVQLNMLTTDCKGTACCAGYSASCQ